MNNINKALGYENCYDVLAAAFYAYCLHDQGKLLSLPHRIELATLLDTIGNNLVKLLQMHGTCSFDLNIENPIHLQRRKEKPCFGCYRLIYS